MPCRNYYNSPGASAGVQPGGEAGVQEHPPRALQQGKSAKFVWYSAVDKFARRLRWNKYLFRSF